MTFLKPGDVYWVVSRYFPLHSTETQFPLFDKAPEFHFHSQPRNVLTLLESAVIKTERDCKSITGIPGHFITDFTGAYSCEVRTSVISRDVPSA